MGIKYGKLGPRFSNGKSLIGSVGGFAICAVTTGLYFAPSLQVSVTLGLVSLLGGIAGRRPLFFTTCSLPLVPSHMFPLHFTVHAALGCFHGDTLDESCPAVPWMLRGVVCVARVWVRQTGRAWLYGWASDAVFSCGGSCHPRDLVRPHYRWQGRAIRRRRQPGGAHRVRALAPRPPPRLLPQRHLNPLTRERAESDCRSGGTSTHARSLSIFRLVPSVVLVKVGVDLLLSPLAPFLVAFLRVLLFLCLL